MQDLSLEEMAARHVCKCMTTNDKSGYMLSKMNRRFGRTATTEAIQRAKDTWQIMSGEPARQIIDNKPRVWDLNWKPTYIPYPSVMDSIRLQNEKANAELNTFMIDILGENP